MTENCEDRAVSISICMCYKIWSVKRYNRLNDKQQVLFWPVHLSSPLHLSTALLTATLVKLKHTTLLTPNCCISTWENDRTCFKRKNLSKRERRIHYAPAVPSSKSTIILASFPNYIYAGNVDVKSHPNETVPPSVRRKCIPNRHSILSLWKANNVIKLTSD